MQIKIQREPENPQSTPGTMQIDGEPFGFTIELPWKDNKPRVSCIPPGVYDLVITHSNRFGKKMILVLDVPDREGIRIHNANFAHQLHGCLAVARKRINDEYIAEGLSQVLQKRIQDALSKGEDVTLEILDPVKP